MSQNENRRLLCLEIQQQVSCDDLVIFSDEAHFHLSGTVNKKNFVVGRITILMRFKNAHCVVLMLLYGAQYQNFTFGACTFSKMTMVQRQLLLSDVVSC